MNAARSGRRLRRWPGLRAQGVGVALLLLAVLPWMHEHHVEEMRQRLQQAQQRALLDIAEAWARALQSAPAGTDASRRPPPVSVARSGLQIWRLDTRLQVRDHWGSLVRRDPLFMTETAAEPADALDRWIVRWVHPWVVPRSVDFSDLEPAEAPPIDDTVRAAAQGSIGMRPVRLPGRDAQVFSVAAPIWGPSGVEGVLIVEQGDETITRAVWHARERLGLMTLLACLAVAGVLALYAGRLTRRLLQLQAEAESSVDMRGRMRRGQGLQACRDAHDELGDLSRSFSTLLERLDRHHDYLQKLARLLAHEVRTPVTSISMSLDNLRELDTTPGHAIYFERAGRGVQRVNLVLTAMTEASRLEDMLADCPRMRFDLADFLRGHVDAWAASRPEHIFEIRTEAGAVPVLGHPEWAAQMLDKLLSNACDFAAPATPIVVDCRRRGDRVDISVANQGPCLPPGAADTLFEPFLSLRATSPETPSAPPHLGIGLHVVRLVAEYHSGRVGARDNERGDGVVFTVSLPLAPGEIGAGAGIAHAMSSPC